MQFKDQIFEKPDLATSCITHPETTALAPTPSQPNNETALAELVAASATTSSENPTVSETPLSSEVPRPNLPPRTAETDSSYASPYELPPDIIPRDFAPSSEDKPTEGISPGPEIKHELEEAVW
jgi:hypothetical protein